MRSILLAEIGFSGIIEEGLKSALSGTRFRICRRNDSLAEFWKSTESVKDRLDGIILDTSNHLPLKLSDLEEIRSWCPRVKIVLMADESRFEEILTVACEADSVILAAGGGPALVKSLELVLLGQRVYPAGLFRSSLAPEPHLDAHNGSLVHVQSDRSNNGKPIAFLNALSNLSDREVQVVNLLCDGSPNKIIARKLGISEATVKVHVKAILRKTRARNRTEAAVLYRSVIQLEDAGAEAIDSISLSQRRTG